MSSESFGPVLPLLSERTGHRPRPARTRRTADIDRPIDVRLMADDMPPDRPPRVDKPDVVGYSLGGGGRCTRRRSTRPRAGWSRSRRTSDPTHLSGDARAAGPGERSRRDFMKETPMYELYQRVAPRPVPELLDKSGAIDANFDYSDEVRGLQVPTLIVAPTRTCSPSHYGRECSSCSAADCETVAD